MLRLWSKFEYKFLRLGMVVLLLAVPLYPKFPLFNVPGTYVAVRAEDFLIAILSAVFFVGVLRRPREFLSDRINQAILIFLAVGLVSALNAVLVLDTAKPHLALLHWGRRLEYFLPFLIARQVVRKEGDVRFYGELLMVVSFIAFLYALGQIHLGFPVISTQSEEFSKGIALRWVPGARLHSTFAGHYDLAAYVVMALPIFIGFFFATKNVLGRLLILISFASAFWLLLASASRIAVPAYLISVIVVLWLLRRRLFIIPVLLISLFFILTTGDIAERYSQILKATFGKFFNLENLKKDKSGDGSGNNFFTIAKIAYSLDGLVPVALAAEEEALTAPVRRSTPSPSPSPPPPPAPLHQDRSTSIRFNVEWPRAVRAFSKNPLLGTGYSSITLATDNDYLRLLGEVGAAGALAFFLILTRLFAAIYPALKKMGELTYSRAFIAGFIGAAIAILVNATFIDVFEASKVAIVFWAIAGISLGAIEAGIVKRGEKG